MKSWTIKKIVDRFGELGSPASLTNAHKLSKQLGLPLERVKKALLSKIEIAQHTRTSQRFRRRKLLALPFHTLSLDLKNLPSLASFNKNHKHILFAIDIARRFLYARPMKSKRAEETAAVLKDIFASMKKEGTPLPRSVYADQGGEFLGRPVTQLLKKHGIHFYSAVDGLLKASACEKVISTYVFHMHVSYDVVRYV